MIFLSFNTIVSFIIGWFIGGFFRNIDSPNDLIKKLTGIMIMMFFLMVILIFIVYWLILKVKDQEDNQLKHNRFPYNNLFPETKHKVTPQTLITNYFNKHKY